MRRALLGLLVSALLPATLHAASSRDNRDDSLVFIGISPVGVHVPTLLTHPIGVGVYLGPNWMIGAEYGSTSADFDDDETEASATYSNLGAYVRLFPGTNSFNIGLAVHRRVFSGDGTTEVTDPDYGTVDVKASLDADATVGSLIIGNQWMMDFGLVLSVDWIVLSGLVSGKTDVSVKGTAVGPNGETIDVSQLDPETRRDAEKELTDLGSQINDVSAFPGVLVFTIGWAF
jgi:hypothetical protein